MIGAAGLSAGCRPARPPEPPKAAAFADCQTSPTEAIEPWRTVVPVWVRNPDWNQKPTTFEPWTFEGQPDKQLRYDASRLPPQQHDLLDMAYGCLRADAQSRQKDQASLGCQAFVHAAYCSGSRNDIHKTGGGLFWAWHRAFLFFHERLLRWVLQHRCNVDLATANTLRVPYWKPSRDFGIFNTGQLYHCRTAGTAKLPELSRDAMMTTDLNTAGNYTLDWHNQVHGWVHGDFSPAATTGLDPMFYAFHSYVDALWEWSHVKGQLSLGQAWAVFYDPYRDDPSSGDINKGWVLLNLQDFADTDRLGYEYQPLDSDPFTDQTGLILTNIKLPRSDGPEYALSMRRRAVGAKVIGDNQEQVIDTIYVFGHNHGTYEFKRVFLEQATVDEVLRGDTWEFVVRPLQGPGEEVVPRPNVLPAR